MRKKISPFATLAFMTLMLLSPLTAHAQTIFDGSTQGGEKVGLCLSDPDHPDCAGVDCESPEFEDDVKCKTEAQIGAELTGNELGGTGIPVDDDASSLVIKIINFILPYLTLAAFVGFVTAGFFYVTAFGNDEQLGKAKTILIWSSVGIVLVIFSFAIVQFLTAGLLGRL